jgi:CBS domain-containing protein
MNLQSSLQTEPVTHVDLSYYVEVEGGSKVRDVIAKMQDRHRKCALVMDHGKLLGIFTERDILKKVVGKPGAMDDVVDNLMGADPVTIGAETPVLEAIELMTERPYRYQPVVSKSGRVIGTLTHYALVKFVSDYFPEEIYNLPPDPHSVTATRDGA